MSEFDDEPTIPDGTNLPFDGDVELLLVDDETPTTGRAPEHRCPRCEAGIGGRGLIRINDRTPQPTRDEARALSDCVSTQTDPEEGGWRWCATQMFLKGLHDVYMGPERRVARLPPPGGVDRRIPSPRDDDQGLCPVIGSPC